MPTPSRQKRAPQADEEAFDSEVFDKENEIEMNGGAGSGSAGKRKQSPADDGDGDDDDHVQQQANADDNDDSPHSPPPPPKHSKKKSKKSASFAAATSDSPMKDRHINPTGKPAEAGIIHEVYVENFMCHRKLSVKLCRNVNFIHGQNGSGKSAILAAIQVCLGAGARRTHRARNLKDLVRKEAGADCAGAKLRVTLLNKGADGYMPEIYGDYITVERIISLRSGGFNGYKLLDATGKERSRSKKDLDAMLDQLNIQVENPVAVLDQEEAKKFLTGKAEDKYEFFTKATELERLDRVYASITDNILEQKATRERALENIQGSIENTRQLKKEWEQFQELDKLEVEVQELRANYGWSVHGEFREQLQEEMKVCSERGEILFHCHLSCQSHQILLTLCHCCIYLSQKAQKYAKALEKRRLEFTTAEQSVNVTDDQEMEVNKQLKELTDEANAAAADKLQLENDLKADQAPIKLKERERGLLSRELAQEKKKHASAIKRLDDARRHILESQGNVAEEERVRTRKIAQTENDLARAREQVEPLKEQVNEHLRKYQDIEPAMQQAKETMDGTERQLAGVQHKMNALQQESGGGMAALAVFGGKCKALYEVRIISIHAVFVNTGIQLMLTCNAPFPVHPTRRLSKRRRGPRNSRAQSPVPLECMSRSSVAKKSMPKLRNRPLGQVPSTASS